MTVIAVFGSSRITPADPLLNNRYTHPDYLPLLTFARSPAEIVQAVEAYAAEHVTWQQHS